MGLPGRRTRERIQRTAKQTDCPCCDSETEVTVQKRKSIMRVAGGGEERLIADGFNGDPEEDAFVGRTTVECDNCGVELTVDTKYQPR